MSKSKLKSQKKLAAHPQFPIVAVGASAGGLEAFSKLLSQLPKDTGMAFVLIQHLSPDYESFLAEILAKQTAMSVVEVRNGMRVEPNRVHVIPPNVSMVIQNQTLQLVRREEHERPHLVIDLFFRALATEQKHDAIGVILSGTGSDGSEGLKMIKGEGGITFAQKPESAKFGGMPRRAISVDHVDFVLTPEEIAKELIKISKHPYLRLPVELDEDHRLLPEKSDLEKILFLVKQSTGVDFTQYKRTTIQRRIMRRMAVQKIELLADYYKVLKSNQSEQIALYNDILINVTSFFRDPEVFEKLKAIVFPALLKNRKQGDPFRIWVPGCATGEEVYSIAIALLEFLDNKSNHYPIQIFGSDLSDLCITRARAGKYMEGIAEYVSQERLNRFFVRADKGYQVNKTVRDCCVFAKQDLVKDPPYSRLDLISCRNVLIYLEPSLQRKILGIFSYAVKPTGFLILGSSETPGAAASFFSPTDKKEKIYTVTSKAVQHRPVFSNPQQSFDVFPVFPQASHSGTSLDIIEKEADRLIVTEIAPPSVVINEQMEILQFRGDTTPFLAHPSGRSSLQILKMAREGLAPRVSGKGKK